MDEVVKEIQRKKDILDARKKRLAQGRAKIKYDRSIKNGDWSTYVPEYEDMSITEYEELRNMDYNEKYKLEDLSDMAKLEVEIRLSKDYQVGAVNVREIDTLEEFHYWRDEALKQARFIYSNLPSKNDTVNTKPQYEKKVVSNENNQYQAPQKEYINTKFAKGKQVGILQSGVDKGLFTVEQVNAIGSWDESQSFISKVFASGKR